MNTDSCRRAELALAVAQGLDESDLPDTIEVVLCPPCIWLTNVCECIEGSRAKLGAQNMSHEADGAFTGEISSAISGSRLPVRDR